MPRLKGQATWGPHPTGYGVCTFIWINLGGFVREPRELGEPKEPQPEQQDDCHRFADMVQGLANRAHNGPEFLDLMAKTFTAANGSSISAMVHTEYACTANATAQPSDVLGTLAQVFASVFCPASTGGRSGSVPLNFGKEKGGGGCTVGVSRQIPMRLKLSASLVVQRLAQLLAGL